MTGNWVLKKNNATLRQHGRDHAVQWVVKYFSSKHKRSRNPRNIQHDCESKGNKQTEYKRNVYMQCARKLKSLSLTRYWNVNRFSVSWSKVVAIRKYAKCKLTQSKIRDLWHVERQTWHLLIQINHFKALIVCVRSTVHQLNKNQEDKSFPENIC